MNKKRLFSQLKRRTLFIGIVRIYTALFRFIFFATIMNARDARARIHGNPGVAVVPVGLTGTLSENDGVITALGAVVTDVALPCAVPVEALPEPAVVGSATGTINCDAEKPYTFERSAATIREPSPLTATERDLIGLSV
jgi:hypothetical protein